MSQFKQKSSALILGLILAGLAALMVLSSSANASVVANAYNAKKGQYQLKTDLASLQGDEKAILDWRNPAAKIKFDIPEGDWSDGLTLHLAGTPQGQVSAKTPLLVSLNNSKAVPVYANGHRFDAEINLSILRLRPTNNTIEISYKVPSGADCLGPQHNSWALDLSRSKLVIQARQRSRDLRIGEVESRLKNTMSAPQTVSIVARGENKTALEALAAQGVGMRMDSVPQFALSPSSKSGLTLYVGTRMELAKLITDPAITEASGAIIAVKSGRPLSLIITANDAADVLELTRTFSSNHLPKTRRSTARLSELTSQLAFYDETQTVEGTTNLLDLGKTYFDANYRPSPAKLDFTIADPAGATGQLLLSLSKNSSVADESRVDVTLNGQALGYTNVNKRSKRVAFDVPTGALKASGNEITIAPVLEAANTGCDAYGYEPGITLGTKSKLTIKSASNTLSLSRLAASGTPFADNKAADSMVLLSPSVRERSAALSILAKLAQTSGTGWANAEFTTNKADAVNTQRNVLVLGASPLLSAPLRSGAPRALTEALNGLVDPSLTAQIIRFAASSESETFAQYASLTQQQRRSLKSGGIAAVYPSTINNGKVIALITANNSLGFIKAARVITQTEPWNELAGSVTRWDANRVVLAQATDVNATFAPAKPSGNTASDFIANFKSLATDTLEQTKSWATNISARQNAPQMPTIEKTQKTAPALRTTPEIVTSTVPKMELPDALKPKASIQKTSLQKTAITPIPTLRGQAPLTAPRMSMSSTAQSNTGPLIDFRNVDIHGFLNVCRAKIKTMQRSFSRHIKGLKNANIPEAEAGSATDRVLGNHFLMIGLLITALILGLVGLAAPASASRGH